jgi:hypothetical protein
VKTAPQDLSERALISVLDSAWSIDVDEVRHAPVGAGSHHWIARDHGGRRWFVTVDDLDQKPWFEGGRDGSFAGLRAAYGTAAALAARSLEFIVAPLPARGGEPLVRLGSHYTAAVFPFLDGHTGAFGEYDAAEEAGIPVMLARLHATAPAEGNHAPRLRLEIPGRDELEAILVQLDTPWEGGPLSEDARATLAQRARVVQALLERHDRLAADMVGSEPDWVITHGEPHGGNLLQTDDGLCLIDWDTAAVAPRERDLWMLTSWTASDGSAYEEAAGARLDGDALAYFRLRWQLADIASFARELYMPHQLTEDARFALAMLRANLRDD